MTQNNVKGNKGNPLLKSLAIAFFIGIIILIAWLSVQLANKAPGAFSSLASLAESIQGRTPVDQNKLSEIVVTSDRTLIYAGETAVLSWKTAGNTGSYSFSYTCTDGMALDLVETTGTRSINCDTNYNLGNVSSLTIKADSEKTRFAELRYVISYLKTDDTAPAASGTAQITVLNSDIREIAMTDEEEKEEEVSPAPSAEPEDNPPTAVDTPTTPVVKPKPVVQPQPTYTQEYVYAIPTSDPNGRIDLGVKYLNAGQIVNNKFVATIPKQDKSGAIQFEVKNFGTKTSNPWTYTVSLPDGDTFKSPTQKALKPNERAVITLGFPATDNTTHTFKIQISDKGDQNANNNRADKTIAFAK